MGTGWWGMGWFGMVLFWIVTVLAIVWLVRALDLGRLVGGGDPGAKARRRPGHPPRALRPRRDRPRGVRASQTRPRLERETP